MLLDDNTDFKIKQFEILNKGIQTRILGDLLNKINNNTNSSIIDGNEINIFNSNQGCFVNIVSSAKQLSPIESTDLGIETWVNEEHLSNVAFCKEVTEGEIVNFFICKHPQKANEPIEVTDEGIVKNFNDLQSRNE